MLNRFDDILASVIDRYSLGVGPQTRPFGRLVLLDSYTNDDNQSSGDVEARLSALGYGPEGDRELVETILDFSRLLFEKCGNRSLYSSSERLGDLLHTTSLSLLQSTLRLSLCLAQRYHARHRGGSHIQPSLLAAHYNMDLEKLQKVAAPFPRPFISGTASASASPAASAKGKEKAAPTRHNANDLISLMRENDGWDEWGHVRVLYYTPGVPEKQTKDAESRTAAHSSEAPSTPTPLRRSATQPTIRSGRTSNVDDSPGTPGNTPSGKQDDALRGAKTLDIPYSKTSSVKAEQLLASHLAEVPHDYKYELLHKVRTAQGLAASHSSRQQVLAIRALAVANLAYVYPEPLFQQKILQYDMEQPKRLQIAYQLAEVLHLGASGDIDVSRAVQTLVIYALDALSKIKSRSVDVSAALSINVNHGVLMFLTRKMVNELGSTENDNDDAAQDEWRDALLGLLRTLPSSSTRTPETLVAAGLIPMLVDILNLRTKMARRVYSRVMEFLDLFVHTVRDALGTLTSAKGFDAISDLVESETKSSHENVLQGAGIPSHHKTQSIDYQVPYFQQQSLRWMFRFVNHIMQHNGGGFDRVLRNMIDSPQLLSSLRLVFESARIFGSHVWSNAVNILSSFIHNEPTSYAVIAEAGLSKSLLEAIMLSRVKTPEQPPAEPEAEGEAQPEGEPSHEPAARDSAAPGAAPEEPREYTIARPSDAQLARGIMPAGEAMSSVPLAFGAICLNASGLQLFQSSHALESFFEIFESPDHVKGLKDDTNLVRSLGSTFDELSRHHPALKSSIMTAVILMVARVGLLCRSKAWKQGMGTKLWSDSSRPEPTVSGGIHSLFREPCATANAANEFGVPTLNLSTLPDGGRLVVGDLSSLSPPADDSLEPKDVDENGLTAADYLYPPLRFLGAFFENQSNCTYFVESGGVEFVLDFASLQSLNFDFHKTDANRELTEVVHMMAETKPHLVIPSIVNRAQTAVDSVSSFWTEPRDSGFFSPMVKSVNEKAPEDGSASGCGTHFAKNMGAALVLTDLLREVYSMPVYQTRPSQQTSAFLQVILADKYSSLVTSLGRLHAACVWEEIILGKNIPDTWDQATKVQPPGTGPERSDNAPGMPNTESSTAPAPESRPEAASTDETAQTQPTESRRDSRTRISEGNGAFKNVQTLRYLLSSLPSSIAGFFHNLGLGLIGKRRMDQYQKQSATMVADHIAKSVIGQLQFAPPNSTDNPRMKLAYLIVILSSFSHLLFEASVDRPHSHYLTLVLFAFKRNHGLKVMKDICDIFVREINALSPPESVPETEKDVSARLTSAYGGIKIILAFFAELASGKNIIDSSQTQAMTSSERERDRPDFFQPAQFLVDQRMEILPIARDLWNSEFAVKSSSAVVKCLVDILRSSLDGEYETGAARHSDTPSTVTEVPRKTLVINKERIVSLHEKGFEKELTKEALYRCNNVYVAAEEYCKAQTWLRAPPRMPPPANDIESAGAGTTSGGEPSEDTAVGDAAPFNGGFLERSALAMLLAQASGRPTDEGADQDQDNGRATENGGGNGTEFLARALNHILNDEHDGGEDGRGNPSSHNPNPPAGSSSDSSNRPNNQTTNQPSEQSSGQATQRREVATVDDLNAERENVRSNLIERCLDILNEHHDVSFELSDLIASATKKHRDPEGFRRDVGEILVQSLVSLQMEDFHAAGKKIAAYAHLLALVLQDRDMYDATLEELKECFGTFLAFIKVPAPEKDTEEAFPWIGHVLLILEKLLSDDAQPQQIRWNPPPMDDPNAESEEPAQLEEPLVAHDEKVQLFESLVDILPRVGKDDTLALAICRVLVILTRSRSIASRLGEKRSLQRLFVMVKQLSSTSNEKLQSAFMLILRHIVEEEDTIRQIMRSEIVSNFESKPTRQVDTTAYVRQMYHLILRAPDLFVEITNEKLKLQRYDSGQRPQPLALKSDRPNGAADTSLAQQGTGNTGNDGANAPGEGGPSEEKDKGKGPELKMPVVENPDGVIHYLLSEILSYKDVDDKESTAETSESTVPDQPGNQTDVEMSTDAPAPSAGNTDMQTGRNSKRTEKPGFKADDHPIYIYRCFLLQCLTELLSSYNRTKVEFINFSRKADPHGTTPQKPRSGILNYLLNALVPVGTMDHDESVAFKKRSNTSGWTMRVLVALCTKTGEYGGMGRRRTEQNNEDEPELAFVRRFVLEHSLRLFKDANASNEALDAKYSRLMSLADLFDKMLSDYAFVSGDAPSASSKKQLEKTMFEKHFISALSASLADIDLNFPSSRRVIKYILRPLNKLTRAAVTLSQTSDISPLGETEEDEISSATSVSDMEDEREETPDLFRHSTLGMLDPRHEGETSSGESEEEDDEMYDDEYDEEMEYDEDMPEDDGEVVSEEDEDEVEGVGPIEGLPGDSGMDIEVVIDEDEGDDEDGNEEGDDGNETEDDEVYAGEITGDRDNESLEGGDDDEWESEEMPEDENEAEMMNQFEDELDDIRQTDQQGDGQRLDDLFRVLNQAAGGVEGLHGDDDLGEDVQEDMVDDDLNDEDDEEVDELEEELDDIDDQGSYQFDDEDAGDDPWWDGDDIAPPRGPHHHRFRGPPAWTAVSGIMPGRPGMVPIQPYRMHRAHAPARDSDDGTNPLLVRSDQPPEAAGQPRGPGQEPLMDWIHGMEPMSTGRMPPMDSPVSFMNAIMQAIGGGQGGPGFGVITRPDGIHVHLDRQAMPSNHLQDIFGLGRPQPPPTRTRDDPSQAVSFILASTKTRWQQEARTLFSSSYVEKSQRVVNSLLKLLVPPAIEEDKRRQKQAEEERKRRDEERAERERQENAAREEQEKERKRKEEEENAMREQERQQQEAERQAAGEVSEPMDDVQRTDTVETAEPSAQAEPAEPPRRVHTTIRGRQLDITGMEIDPEYLEALPEELREEVIMQQLAEQRSQAAAAGEEPSEINPEFLEALPPEIREELLQQEAADRRRRERDGARRQAAAAGGGGGPARAEDMDAASFLATLDPSLRQAVIADQPEEVLANLGPEYVSEARALTGRRLAQFGDVGRVDHRQRNEPVEAQEPKRSQRRQIVQMLDKAGIATLIRLMFMPLQGNARHQLNDILQNVCENRQNRSEVISLLLSVLQDGSADVSAIERSFTQLSLRAKVPPAQKTPQSVKKNVTLQSTSGVSSEVTPMMVVQQCLGTLSFLSQYNPHIAWFFLTEHDPSSTLKLKAFRKGKAKENRANKFALNALLSLLDRSLIMENPNCMEQLSTLLSSITQPLTLLLRREKEKQEEEKKGKQPDRPQDEGRPEERDQPVQPSETVEAGTGGDTTMADAPLPTVEGAESHRAGNSAQDQEGAPSDANKGAVEKKPQDQKPKRRSLEPPVVPHPNLRLVVRILSARECNGKTFRDTLSTINNLSILPGAREVIGRELVTQSQGLSTAILTDLTDLLSHIHQARTGTDMQGLTLAKFSPASSDQAKLLRILTALDYLLDPTRVDKIKGLEPDSNAKEDTLKALYEGASFGPLWERLSDCLTVIRHKENMLNVATILLPLIEALMVVCKNTTLKDTPVARNSRELSVSSGSPDVNFGMENLFFKFTEEHRKILNELVRQNPKLMSGTFSLLVKNPKVLEFDNKRNYFTRRLHSRGAEARHPHPPLQLSVRRDQVFLDSFKSLYFKTAEELKYGKLNVRFHGEEGVDAGGVTREWFQVLARGMFNPNYALFIPVASDRTTFHPNRLSGINSEHLMFYKFIGRIIGKALYEGRVLDCHFSRAVYKCILGRHVSIKDMETLDLDYYKSLLWMLENDITDIITETFSVETDDFGEKQVIDLKENGRDIPVTQENKEEYVQRVVDYRLVRSVREQLDNFLKGMFFDHCK